MILPTVIVTAASTARTVMNPNPEVGRIRLKTRSAIAAPATLGATDKSAATGFGAPSNTSGTHI